MSPGGKKVVPYKGVVWSIVVWEQDDVGCYDEAQDLVRMLGTYYKFHVEIWKIPLVSDCHLRLQNYLRSLVDRCRQNNELLVVCYSGHGSSKRHVDVPHLVGGPFRISNVQVDWAGLLQNVLRGNGADVLLILNCCCAAGAFLGPADGKLVTIAACRKDTTTPAPGPGSFIFRLIDVLRKFGRQHQSFNIQRLFEAIEEVRPYPFSPVIFNDPPGASSEVYLAVQPFSSFSVDDPEEQLVDLFKMFEQVSIARSRETSDATVARSGSAPSQPPMPTPRPTPRYPQSPLPVPTPRTTPRYTSAPRSVPTSDVPSVSVPFCVPPSPPPTRRRNRSRGQIQTHGSSSRHTSLTMSATGAYGDKVEHVLQFPRGSIDHGQLTIGDVREKIADLGDIRDSDEIGLSYRGQSLQDDDETCLDAGITNGATLVVGYFALQLVRLRAGEK